MSRSRDGRGPRQKVATAVAIAAVSAASAAGAAAPASLAANTAAAARKTCAITVTIDGKRACLAAGKSCKRKHESKYKSKGFSCKRTSTGSYRLKQTKLVF